MGPWRWYGAHDRSFNALFFQARHCTIVSRPGTVWRIEEDGGRDFGVCEKTDVWWAAIVTKSSQPTSTSTRDHILIFKL